MRSSRDATGNEWTEPIPIGRETAKDDLCAIVSLRGIVGLVWSDQGRETMYFCSHKDGADANSWGQIEEIDSGDKTADDHVNCAVGSDGTLYLATKNSVDTLGHAQLRVAQCDMPTAGGTTCPMPNARRPRAESPHRSIRGQSCPPVSSAHALWTRNNGSTDEQIVWQSFPFEV